MSLLIVYLITNWLPTLFKDAGFPIRVDGEVGLTQSLAIIDYLDARYPAPRLVPHCVGEAPTLADCCLVPQVANAQRMGCDLSRFERVMAVYGHCMAQPAFNAAAPGNQPDYVG